MNNEERITQNYLVSCGHENIVYEPDGNVPPDFAVNSAIGVEVRRLNQNYFSGPRVKGLEQDQIRLYRGVVEVLNDFDEQDPVQSYWITLRYTRPLGNLKRIKNRTRTLLRSFLDVKPKTPHEIEVTPNFSITVIQAGMESHQRFWIGIQSDYDDGGWLIPLYIDNIDYCSREKAKRILPYLNNYTKWWLVLVDTIMGISSREIPDVVRSLKKPAVWDRIVVLEPTTNRILFEI